jgi:hypothetical protein
MDSFSSSGETNQTNNGGFGSVLEPTIDPRFGDRISRSI